MDKYNTQQFGVVVVVTIVLSVLGGCFGCRKDELDALLQLKSAINDYPNGTALPDWKEEEATGRPSDCCAWARVVCDGESGRVAELHLDYVREGEGEWHLNASLFLPFPYLWYLSLRGNSITAWTHHLRQLSSLYVLLLGYNKLEGMIDLYDVEALQNLNGLGLGGNRIDGFKRIHGNPLNSSASKLESLYLYGITFRDANTFFDSLLSLPSLNYLDLGGNVFKGVIPAAGGLCQLNKMKELHMAYNGLRGQLPSCLRNLTSLQYLNLSRNNLQGELPSFLANLTSMKYLDLTSNQFVGNVANSPLTKLTSLIHLSLSNNKFQIPRTFSPFANHSNLISLFLDGNNVIMDYATNQPSLPNFQLSFLSLSNCKIGVTIPSFIHRQYRLAYLDLSHNHIDGRFPSWILENNTRIKVLTLANNLLIGSLNSPKYPHFEIQLLDVSNNNINYLSTNLSHSFPNILYLNFSKNSIKVLAPLTFSGLKILSWLDLSYNELTGELPRGWLEGCFSLKALFLSQNTLEVIPLLSTSSSLRFLRLNNNNLSGTIPSGLFPVSLELLDLSSNHLRGSIPREMCKLTHLISINLSNNNISGFLPLCFDSRNLLYVYLYQNNLNGPLLPVFKNNTSLLTVNLGDNHLSGMIPEWIGNLRNLSILSLQNNHFEGHIPSQVCFLDQLTILDLSGNNIDGQIPRCLGQTTFQPFETKSSFQEQGADFLSPLTHVKMHNIRPPENFEAMFGEYLIFKNKMKNTTKSHTYNYEGIDLDGMTSVNLAWNKLNGEIPLEIGSMAGVRALNLSHNELTNWIPSSLSKLSNIESLDLSYNNLNGSIPSELIKLTARAVFTVAHNNLSGRTPEQKAQFGTFEESSYEGNPFLC